MNKRHAVEQLFKTNPIKGNFCHLYHIEMNDAGLIFDLRTKREDNFLKITNGTVDDQKKYLEGYYKRFADREEIYYKILDLKTQKFSGILRLTQIQDDGVFNWQSFVVSSETSPNMPLDAMLMIYRIGFEFLSCEKCGPWEVDKEFVKMMKIHNLIKMAKIVDENEKYYLVAVQKSDYENNINKFLKMSYGRLEGLL